MKLTCVALLLLCPCVAHALEPNARKPNVILILCDDLGFRELGCYGQEKIKTPHIDRLAAEGMKFSQFYSGSPVCAPSRCTLLTGKHTGHGEIRDNLEVKPEGQWPIPAETQTLGNHLQQAGYTTACIGKWGLGGPGSTGEPNAHGFDHFYGHLCQRLAHNQYTTHLWRDGKKEVLEGNVEGNLVGRQYAPDLMAEDALQFIRSNKARPFFLYFATPLPHLALQAPSDAIEPYLAMKWNDPPYDGKKGYLPHEHPRAAYAAMVTRIDDYVGKMVGLVKELGLENDTLFLLASDNGTTFALGGIDPPFFKGAGELRGLKQDVYEGGIRSPLIARWTGKIAAGSTSDHIAALWDLFPTLIELAGGSVPRNTDGISIVPTLLGKPDQLTHAYLYWEYHSQGGKQAVRMGNWKGVRTKVNGHLKDAPLELYDLATDPSEQKDVANQHPDVAGKIMQIMLNDRTESSVEKWRF